MPLWLITILGNIAVSYLQWLTQYINKNPSTLTVTKATPQDKKKWKSALDSIDRSRPPS